MGAQSVQRVIRVLKNGIPIQYLSLNLKPNSLAIYLKYLDKLYDHLHIFNHSLFYWEYLSHPSSISIIVDFYKTTYMHKDSNSLTAKLAWIPTFIKGISKVDGTAAAWSRWTHTMHSLSSTEFSNYIPIKNITPWDSMKNILRGFHLSSCQSLRIWSILFYHGYVFRPQQLLDTWITKDVLTDYNSLVLLDNSAYFVVVKSKSSHEAHSTLNGQSSRAQNAHSTQNIPIDTECYLQLRKELHRTILPSPLIFHKTHDFWKSATGLNINDIRHSYETFIRLGSLSLEDADIKTRILNHTPKTAVKHYVDF